MAKVFKKLGKSKLARGLLAAAAVYFLGSYLSDAGDAADVSGEWGTGAGPADGGLDSEALANATGGGAELVAEPPGTPLAEPLSAPPVASPPPAPAPAPAPPTPATQPSVPAPNAQPVAPTVPMPGSNLASRDGGIIAGAAKWFSSLSPGGQAMLAAGTAGGAAAVMQALSQKSEQEAQEQRDARAEENKQRRTAVAAISPSAYRPRSGIIGSRNGG